MAITLATKELLKGLPRGTQSRLPTDKKMVMVKFTAPQSDFRWYVVGGKHLKDGDVEFYGFVKNSLGCEWGYFWLSELKSLNAKRDELFQQCPAAEVTKKKIDCSTSYI